MLSIREYLLFGLLSKDPQKARKLRVKAPQYRVIDRNLSHKSYLSPWLLCIGSIQAKSIIQEIHQGSYSMHAGTQSVVSKIIKLGYYWPSMHIDAKEEIQNCEAYQIHSSVPKMLKALLMAPGGTRFLVVAIDYFTKWVEAKPLVSITGKHMEKFIWEHIVWICQISQEISQKRTRERMSDQEAKEIKAEAREIMPQPSTVNCS
ncbi:reverse transcriptase domain-containing protein [Tanacetum coccineum]